MSESHLPKHDADEVASIGSPAPDFYWAGKWISISLSALVLVYMALERDQFWAMSANEFGDFLSGVFGPLALLWVVLGFLQQGAELRYSRDALLLQAKELKESVAAQRDMGKAAWEQVTLGRDGLLAARAREIEPLFTLKLGAGYTSGGIRHYELYLSNEGAIAHNVEVNASCSYSSFLPRQFPEVKAGNPQVIALEFKQEQALENFEVTVGVLDRQNGRHEWMYQVQHVGNRLSIENIFGTKTAHP